MTDTAAVRDLQLQFKRERTGHGKSMILQICARNSKHSLRRDFKNFKKKKKKNCCGKEKSRICSDKKCFAVTKLQLAFARLANLPPALFVAGNILLPQRRQALFVSAKLTLKLQPVFGS